VIVTRWEISYLGILTDLKITWEEGQIIPLKLTLRHVIVLVTVGGSVHSNSISHTSLKTSSLAPRPPIIYSVALFSRWITAALWSDLAGISLTDGSSQSTLNLSSLIIDICPLVKCTHINSFITFVKYLPVIN
jgi:hypothetical protein